MKNRGVKSILTNATYLASAHGITGVVRGLYAIILARFLGPEIYGIFNYGLSWYLAFLPFSMLGLELIIAREVGRDRQKGASVVIKAFYLRMGMAVFVATVSALIAILIEHDSTIRILLIILSIALVGRAIAMWANGVFTAHEVSAHALQQEVAFRTVEVLGGFTILSAGGDIVAVALMHALTWWLQAIRGVWLVKKYMVWRQAYAEAMSLSHILVKGLVLGLGGIFSTWLLQGPLVLYKHISGMEAYLGQLALAMQALFILNAIPWALSRAALPVLSRSAERGDGKDKVYLEGMFRIGILIGALIALTGMAFGAWFVTLIFGDAYTIAGELLGSVLWLLILLIWSTTLTQVMIAKGHYLLSALCSFLGALAFTALAPVLNAELGLYGIIIATGAGMFVWFLGLVFCVYREDRFAITHTLILPLLAMMIAVIIYLALMPVSTWLAYSASLMAMLAGYFIFQVIRPPELENIKQFIVALVSRR